MVLSFGIRAALVVAPQTVPKTWYHNTVMPACLKFMWQRSPPLTLICLTDADMLLLLFLLWSTYSTTWIDLPLQVNILRIIKAQLSQVIDYYFSMLSYCVTVFIWSIASDCFCYHDEFSWWISWWPLSWAVDFDYGDGQSKLWTYCCPIYWHLFVFERIHSKIAYILV